MRRFTILSVVLLLLSALAVSAQVRGTGRLQGTVTDEETGKPVAGAKVTITIADGSTQPIVSKTDARGRWAALGLVSGAWNIDIEAPGYVTTRGAVSVSELQLTPPLKLVMTPEKAKAPAAAAPVAAAVPLVSDETRAAITEAQNLLIAQEGDMIPSADPSQPSHTVTADDVKAYGKKAAELLEQAIPQIPTGTPELDAAHLQIQQVLAQAWYRAGDVKKAIANLEKVVAADAANTGIAMLLVNLYLEDERLADGKALLEKLPAASVTDPTVHLNVGILFLNKGSVEDALGAFEKAVAMDDTRPESYYYRALANVQLKKMAEAKADFEKVISLAPDSSEGRDAKQMLASMK